MEYVFSGSRLKLFMPKETCLITFLLAGEPPRHAVPREEGTAPGTRTDLPKVPLPPASRPLLLGRRRV